MPFVSDHFFYVTETEISNKKTPKKHDIGHSPLQAFSLDLFMILGVFFLRYYEFNLKAQLEGAAEPYR